MHQFTVKKTLDVGITELWALVSDFANLDWYEGPERVEREGEGPGMKRRIFMAGSDAPVEEQLLSIDHAAHRMEYAVLEGGMNIMRDYRVVAELQANGDTTQATWDAQFSGLTVDGVDPEMMVQVMSDTYASMLSAMANAARNA